MKQVELESRNCHACGNIFRVMVSSKQAFCSEFCDRSGVKWDGEPSKDWRGNERRSVTVTVPDTLPIQNSEKRSVYAIRGSQIGKPSREKSSAALPSSTTQRPLLPIASKIEDTDPGRSKLKDTEFTTSSIETESAEKISNTSEDSILPTVLPKQSEILREEILDSLSSLRSTSKHLFSLMKGLNPNLEGRNQEEVTRLLDPDRARVAAEVSKQMISSIRMQLDLLKFFKECRDEKV